MKVLLIYPQTPNTFWNLKYALKFISKQAVLPPLGLLTVAAMLPKDWQKKLIDMTIEPLTDSDIRWADMVFVSGMYIQKDAAKKIIKRCNKLNTKVVAGGPLFTAAYDHFDNIDHLVLNEAEITLPLFLKDLEKQNPKKLYTTKKWADLTQTPIPLWDLVDMNKYALMCIQYSRGCPFSCDFCDVTSLFGNKTRFKTTDQLLEELQSLYSRGWRDRVFIVDDNFIGNKKKIKNEVLPAMIKWMSERNHPFALSTQVSVNIVNDEHLMKLMVEAGFETVFVGIETPHEESLAECDKSQNRNLDLMASVKKIQSFGLQVQGGFIVGFDSDKPSIFDKMIAFIQESGIVTAMVGLLNAPRGTKLYDRLLKADRLVNDSSGSNTDFSMNFIPKMNKQQLIEGYKRVVKTIYSPKYYYPRIITLLKNYKPTRKNRFKFNWCDIKALIKSTWSLGIWGKGRFHYWKLILWSLTKKPQLFQMAVTLAIYGFHFRKTFAS